MGAAVAAVAVRVGAVGRTAGLQGALLVCGPREQRYVSGQVKSLTAMAGNDCTSCYSTERWHTEHQLQPGEHCEH